MSRRGKTAADLLRERGQAADSGAPAPPPNGNGQAGYCNYYLGPPKKGQRRKRFGYPLQALEARLRVLTGGWPMRVGNLLFAPGADYRPLYLETPTELMAWVSRHLPPGKSNGLVWGKAPDMVSEGRLFSSLCQTARSWSAVEPYPHWPELPGHYYLHPAVGGGDGSALEGLLGRFAPATPADADLLRGFVLSLFWGGPPGARPAWLLTADPCDRQGGRGVGKSTAAKLFARLAGGHSDLAAGERMGDVITRLLTPDALDRRIVLIDNVKSLKFSWAELEALITADSISGHRLYHGEGRRPNTLTVVLTLNGASLSRDLAQRCVVIRLRRPAYSGDWETETIDYIEARRWQIIGDCLAELKREAPPLARFTRWGAWERGVLSRLADPPECQSVIAERQDEADDDGAEAELVRDAIRAMLVERGHDADRDAVFIPSKQMASLSNTALESKRPSRQATIYLAGLALPELRHLQRSDIGGRGWEWRGSSSDEGATVQKLRERTKNAAPQGDEDEPSF